MEITKPQTLMGVISQMAAGSTHYVAPARLRSLSASLPKVLILTGDQDNLVLPRNSKYLKENMPEAEYIIFEGTGHGLQVQRKKEFHELLERIFKEGKEKSSRA
jgi:pimeloyl-ACP methyl ester carboxylesterase